VLRRTKRLTLIRASAALSAIRIKTMFRYQTRNEGITCVEAQPASWISLIFVNPPPSVATGLRIVLQFHYSRGLIDKIIIQVYIPLGGNISTDIRSLFIANFYF